MKTRKLLNGVFLCAAALTIAMTTLITSARTSEGTDSYFLIFTAAENGGSALYRMNPDGSGKGRVIDVSFRSGSAHWSPRDMSLSYLQAVGGSQFLVHRIRWDGAADQVLTGRNVALIDVKWSPDGTHLLLENGMDSLNEMTLHRIAASDGTTTLVRDAFGSGAAYSPDGAWIAFHSRRTGAYQAYVMRADGSDERLLTGNSFGDFVLDWSPDGERVLFLRTFMRDFGALYDVRADGSDLRRLTPEGATAQPEQAVYSPDGRWIAFTQSNAGKFDIYVVPASGGEATRLTEAVSNEMQPAWSPDSQWIAYVSNRAGSADIWRMRPDGSDAERLTADPGNEQLPVWSPAYGSEWEPGSTLFLLVVVWGTIVVAEKRETASYKPQGAREKY